MFSFLGLCVVCLCACVFAYVHMWSVGNHVYCPTLLLDGNVMDAMPKRSNYRSKPTEEELEAQRAAQEAAEQVSVHVRSCVCACVCVRARMCVCVCVCVCVQI